MREKIFILILTAMLLILLISCSSNENQYAGKYITFNYPNDWEFKVNESINGSHILFENEGELDFNIDLRIIKNIGNEEEIVERLERELNEGYQNAQKMESIKVISYENTTIDGGKAKKLVLEIQQVDSTIEQLYYLLKEDLVIYDEINVFLDEYGDTKDFISKIKNDPQKLEKLKMLLLQLEVKGIEEQRAKMVADSFIDNIYHFSKEGNDNLLKLKNILSIKENFRLNIYIQGKIEDYEESKESIQKIIDSIKFNL